MKEIGEGMGLACRTGGIIRGISEAKALSGLKAVGMRRVRGTLGFG